jgi:hypothetical protein
MSHYHPAHMPIDGLLVALQQHTKPLFRLCLDGFDDVTVFVHFTFA